MTKQEFLPILAYLQVGCGMKGQPTEEQVKVYFDLLHDLPAAAVGAAAKQALIDHEYPNLPPVGVIRRHAVAIQKPSKVPGPEAWRLALEAARRFDPDVDGSAQRCFAKLPAEVRRAVECFGGLGVIVNTTLCQHQFLERYESLGEHEERVAIMPPSVKAIAAQVAGAFGIDGPNGIIGDTTIAPH